MCLVVAGLAETVAQPFETLVQTVSGGGASGLDVLWFVLSAESAVYGRDHDEGMLTQARCLRL